MKRLALVGSFAAALLVVAACQRAQPAGGSGSATSSLSEITQRGELRVGYLVWDPTVIRDPRTNRLTGLYPDAIAEIAKALNVKVSWHETTLATFAAALSARQFDFFAGAVFVTIPRSVAVAYTQPVAYVGNSGVVRRDGPFHPASIRDLLKPRLRVAVLQGQALEEYCRRNLPEADLVIIAGGDLTAPLAAVSAGRADIGLMNSVTVSKYASEHQEVLSVFVGPDQIEVLPLAWATRHQDQELLSFLNSSITYLKSTGRLEGYQKAYPTQLLYDVPALHAAR